MTSFSSLGISETFLKALQENNITTPTPIQIQTIPFLLGKGTDLVAQAQTGTGKTAAFGLPLLEKADPANNAIQALILSPTRELCQQIAKQLFRFTKYGPKIFVEAVYGGAPINDQIRNLQRPTHIVVATPGRLIDLLERKAISLEQVKTIVLDEADEMLSMGFKKELEQILSKTGNAKNTWLFSATMSPEINAIIKTYLAPDAHRVQIDKENIVNKDIQHSYILCENKLDVLIEVLKKQEDTRGVIFCRTKATAQTLAKQLISKNFAADAIHGDLLQKERDKVMRAFKNHNVQILIATDLAARGIDVENLAYVIHYQMPDQTEYYTHRSGRTARAGKKGFSLSLVANKELKQLKQIEAALKIVIQQEKP